MLSPPRIALVSPNRNAYSETFIRAHIKRLQGVELVLIDGFLPKRRADGSLLIGMSIVDRLRRRALACEVEEELERRIASELASHAINVVLAEYGPTGEAMLPICRRLGIPLVVHFHGVDAFHESLLHKHQRYRALLAEAAGVIVVSEEMLHQLYSLGAVEQRTHLIYYGVDTISFDRPDRITPSRDLLAVGRFADTKAPYLTMLAFHRAWKEVPELRLRMIGDGPLLESCWQMRDALGLNYVVDLPGVQSQQEVALAMQRSLAFVQHSLITTKGDREGTPLAILEALSSGLPVVATRHAGIGEVIEHGRTGLLCEERDLISMSENMVILARDADLVKRMGLRHVRIFLRITMSRIVWPIYSRSSRRS